jgi:transcriptional regulator with XRE-family HTH domain
MTRNESERTVLPRKPSLSLGEEDPAFYEALGRAIKVARTQQDLSRKSLAERAGVSYAYLSDIETGRGRPSSKALLAVAGALGRTPSELLHEAELYGAMREMADPHASPPAIGAAPRSPWFHASAGDRPAPAPQSLPASGPTRTEWQRLARSRLSGRTASERAELHAIVDGLSDDDVHAVLEIARRLLGLPSSRT